MITDFYKEKIQILKNSHIKKPELDLRILIEKSLKKKKLFLLQDLKLNEINLRRFNSFFQRRIKGEPISKILNKKEFWDLEFFINKNVLDPRNETEHLIETVIDNYDKNEKLKICDLGTGSGCIIITLLKYFEKSKGYAYEISKKAIEVAKINAKQHKVINRLELIQKSWINLKGKFDLIVSNPPYIRLDDYSNLQREVRKFDPKISLISGRSGLEKYEELASIVVKCMKKNSIFITEIGYNQRPDVEKIFLKSDLKAIKIIKDLQEIDRILVFKRII